MTDTTAILGYAWPLVVSPGENLAFHLSSAMLQRAEACLVRVRCADPSPVGPGLKLLEMDCDINGPVALVEQPTYPGSCAIVPDQPALHRFQAFSVGAFVWPTRLGGRAQTILARWRDDLGDGWRLGLDAQGRIEFTIGRQGRVWSVTSPNPVLEREWIFVGGAWDPDDMQLRVFIETLDPQAGRDRSATTEGEGPSAATWPGQTALTFAAHALEGGASPRVGGHYDGKIDRPRVFGQALASDALRRLCEAPAPSPGDPHLVGAWDFSLGIPTEQIHDRTTNRLDGRLQQAPLRGVTGANWDGRSERWTETPSQYGAIHFHSDDLADAGWRPTLRVTIPDDWRSGFYALRLRAQSEDEIPIESFVSFFVRAPLGQARARLAFVASTATFLAYANSALKLDQVHAEVLYEGVIALSRDDMFLQEHREFGLSTYDTHADGSGWAISSARRPILNMRPRGNVFNYGDDTYLLDWLEALGYEFDVITDDDIHEHGAQLLSSYACVITGSHPEYVSREMWDAFDAYQRGGGRHMYLGGNGFYWRIGYHPSAPHTIEIRRGVAGMRTWEGEAGENVLACTGEPSGLWRSIGRPPQRLLGVGFSGAVLTHSSPYRWLEGARSPGMNWLTKGIDLDAPLGDFGARGKGAAGLEVDRTEPTLGSPPGLMWLATADRLGWGALPGPEEIRTLHRGVAGDENGQVRADVVFFPTANGGGVFSTGSIAWVTALPHHNYENNVSQLTANVLARFLDPRPIGMDGG